MDFLVEKISSTNLSDDNEQIKMQTLALDILIIICEWSQESCEYFSLKGGVDSLIQLLQNSMMIKTDVYLLFVLSLLKCVQSCILGTQKNSEIFIESEGVSVLLDFLENSELIHQPSLLSLLTQFASNQQTKRFFEDWQSQHSGSRSLSLLIKIYKEQEERLKIQYEKGVLIASQNPTSRQRPL